MTNKQPLANRKVIIVDIDGTITDDSLLIPYPTGNSRKDRNKFYKEMKYYNHVYCKHIKPIYEIVDLINKLQKQDIIPLFVTAREDTHNGIIRENTLAFLRSLFTQGLNNLYVRDSQLLMREENDLRPNYEVKEDLYNKYIKDYFQVLFCLEDEENNVEMFRKNGLLVLQVKQGNILDN